MCQQKALRAQFLRSVAGVASGRPLVREAMILEFDVDTGLRLKVYSRPADVEYWTSLWHQARGGSYGRSGRGHLPHQLRDTWRRWVQPGSSVLEAGCGLGHFTVAANALGYRAEGLDWSEQTIVHLRERFPQISWHVGDVRRLGFPDDAFDSIYSPGVCEHFEEGPVGVLTEVRRVLRTGGVAVVTSPCFNRWLQQRASALASPEPPAGVAFHEYVFTPEGMTTLFERLGFAVVQVRPYAALQTLVRHGGWRVPGPARRLLALVLDYMPIVREWGSSCVWVARKR
jgi:SAM-dependent methyltransferase